MSLGSESLTPLVMMLSTSIYLCSHSMYWISNTQLIMETNVSNYALTVIISIVDEENQVHSVTFHTCTFTIAKLNYDTHDNKLLTVFETFNIWQHYLEDLAFSINVFIKNFVIRFCSSYLGTKLDTFTK